MTQDEVYQTGDRDHRATGRSGWRAHCPHCAAAQGRRSAWRHHDLSPGSAAVHRQADRAAGELRRPGGDRDGERAAARPSSARRWSSRPRPPRCCRSSMPRRAIWRRCSIRCWKRRCGFARPRSAAYSPMTASGSIPSPALGVPAALDGVSRRRNPPSPVPGSTAARLLETSRSHHILDRGTGAGLLGRRSRRAERWSNSAEPASMLNVPLRKEDARTGLHLDLPAGGACRSPTSRSRCWRISPPRR